MEIYKITNKINGKIYIGKDTTSNPQYLGSGKLIKRAILKYGVENFTKEILDQTDDYSDLSKKEIFWIKKFDSNNLTIGYNISNGGDGGDTLSNNPNLGLIKEKISKNNIKTGKTYEEAFGIERAKQYKEKLKLHLNKSLLSKEALLKRKKYYEKLKKDYELKCYELKKQIENGEIKEHLNELKKIKEYSYHSFLKNIKGFYNFFGDDLKKYFYKPKKEKVKKVKPKKTNLKDFRIYIDGTIYSFISEASKKLGISRSLIKHRLYSPIYKEYYFLNDSKNVSKNKEPYENNRKKIQIDGIIYLSIKDASESLNLESYKIYHRLNSTSYPRWLYMNGTTKKNICEKRNKKISIDGFEYESISEASKKTKISRELIRYRLRVDKFKNYIYL
jgi:hypothetical protein